MRRLNGKCGPHPPGPSPECDRSPLDELPESLAYTASRRAIDEAIIELLGRRGEEHMQHPRRGQALELRVGGPLDHGPQRLQWMRGRLIRHNGAITLLLILVFGLRLLAKGLRGLLA